jgi:hypothetical protein
MTEEAVARFKKDLVVLLSAVKDYLERAIKAAETDPDGRLTSGGVNHELAVKLGKQFAEILRGLGYDDALRDLIDAFESVAAETDAAVTDRLGVSLSAASHGGLEAFVSGAIESLIAIAGKAAERLRDVLLLAATSHMPREEALQALADAVGGRLSEARTIAETTLMAFHRKVLTTQSEDAGTDLFVYTGPDDDLTRPFCERHVDRVYTTGDLDDEDNGTDLQPTSEFLGGFNCRHILSPISVEDAKQLGAEAIGGPEARRIVLRGATGPAEAAYMADNRGMVVNGSVVRRRAS